MNRYDPIFNVLQYALHPPAVIIVQKDMTLSYPSLVPSTRFPTGTVLVLLTPVRFNCGLRRSRFSIPITRGRPLLEPPVLVKHFILRVRVADDTQHVLVETVGVEPTVPEAEDLQSPGVTNFPTSPCIGRATGNRTPLAWMKTRCPNR